MAAGFVAQNGLHERESGDLPFHRCFRHPFGWDGLPGERDVWSETFLSVGQPVLYQVGTDVVVQVLQRVRNNRRAKPAQPDFREVADGIQCQYEWPEVNVFEKAGEMFAHVFGLVAEKCHGQMKVLLGDDASLYLLLQAGNPVNGMTVGYQCDKQSSRYGLYAGSGVA